MNQIDIAREYLDAYARNDLEAVARLLDDEVQLQDWNLSAAGKDAALRETKRNFESARSIEISVRGLFENTEGVAAQLSIVIDGSVALEVVDVLRFSPAGRITSIRAYKG